MKSRFFLIISIVLFVFSCSHFVNLGDDDAYSADNDNTEGLPDEISEDRADTAGDSNYDDWNEDYDSGSDAAPEPTESADTQEPEEDSLDNDPGKDSTDDEWTDTDIVDSDNYDPVSDEDPYVFPESGDPFPEGFSNAGCGCGSTPDYVPVCCDGMISVFNACFANCYAVNSGNKICSSYETGLCGGAGIITGMTGDGEGDTDPVDDEDSETDGDTELPDEDAGPAGITNECGCYPEDEAAVFGCGGSLYFITECLASCHCDDPQRIFF